MNFLRPRDWTRFQHYRERRPVWIKLHKDLLDNYEFFCLPLIARALAPMLWLIASEDDDGCIALDYGRLSFRLRTPESDVEEAVKALIAGRFFELLEERPTGASETLSGREQSDCLETETETETEGETETETEADRRVSEKTIIVDVFDHWRGVLNHPTARLDDKRKNLIRRALKLGYSHADLKAAIDGCRASPFHMGENDRQQKYDGLDLILRDASKIDQFIGYTKHKPSRLGRAGSRTAQAARDWIDDHNGGAKR